MHRKPKPQPRPPVKQPLPGDLTASLLDLIRRKYYDGDFVQFAKDKRQLLLWVVWWPAKWLETRGVTLPADRYRQILSTVLLDALAHASDAPIKYRPAWLGKVIQSHFDAKGEDYYEEGKAMRNRMDHVLAMVVAAGQTPKAVAPDPIRALTEAARLLQGTRKRPARPLPDKQRELF
jgi:hypothetical protein